MICSVITIVVVLVGDFNVNFDRGGALGKLLVDFLSELNLCACDMSFHSSVNYTYEREDGSAHSWIDHYCMLSVLFLSCDQCTHHTFGL